MLTTFLIFYAFCAGVTFGVVLQTLVENFDGRNLAKAGLFVALLWPVAGAWAFYTTRRDRKRETLWPVEPEVLFKSDLYRN
jgi:hypothetical protein